MLLSDTLKIYFTTFFIGKPLSIFNDDNAANSFALCPNLYRAFDRGIIGVDKHYRVVISYYITKDETRAYSLKQLVSTELYLPMPQKHFPLMGNFLWQLGRYQEQRSQTQGPSSLYD